MRLAVPIQQAVLVAVLALGCTHTQPPPESAGLWRPSAVEPADDAEREILRRLPELAQGQPMVVAGQSVVVDAAYPAASGRTCRSLRIGAHAAGTGQSNGQAAGESMQERLACREDGDWFFVPPVFQAEGGDASGP